MNLGFFERAFDSCMCSGLTMAFLECSGLILVFFDRPARSRSLRGAAAWACCCFCCGVAVDCGCGWALAFGGLTAALLVSFLVLGLTNLKAWPA